MRRFLHGALLVAGLSTAASAQKPSHAARRSPIDSAMLAKQPSWYAGYFQSFDEATAALDLKPLRDTRLPRGEREVRVWMQVEIGIPKRMVRVRDVGGRLTGEGVLYWPASSPDASKGEKPGESLMDMIAYNHAGTCGPIRVKGEMAACRVRYVAPPDWTSIVRAAEGAGLWTIPDPATLPSDGIITVDGWTIVVELRTADSYRSYRYNSPEAHPKWPSAAQAIRIAETFARADSLLAPPEAQRTYKGVTRGSYRSGIRLCSGETWEFADELASAARRQGMTMPDSTGKTEPEYYVEVTGIASPEWAAKQWESKFPRVLSAGRLNVVKLSTGAECAR